MIAETEEQRKYRYLAYSNFQYICIHNEFLENPKIQKIYDELLEYFLKRSKVRLKRQCFNCDDEIALAKITSSHPYESIIAPKSKDDVLEFAKFYESKKYLLII